MSAGSGITHSELNANNNKDVKLLQIWLFPNKKNVKPRYDQISIKDIETLNEFYQILSPNKEDKGVWIHQNAWFHLGEFTKKQNKTYTLKDKSNGVYAFVLEGNAIIAGQSLNKRDGFGIWNIDKIDIQTEAKTKILLMEVPMTI
jgi:redox-sensitive bicupin YhaK (pirin superfamily)